MLEGWFSYFILLWGIFLIITIFIGGFFMFRKFLKRLPKADGKSEMDWEEYYVNKTRHLWDDTHKAILEELVRPVPELFRDVARHKIAGKIGEIALNEQAEQLSLDLLIRGYIMATPKRDHKFLRKKLTEMNMDLTKYEHLF